LLIVLCGLAVLSLVLVPKPKAPLVDQTINVELESLPEEKTAPTAETTLKKKLTVRKLDLRYANVTYLTGEVNPQSVNAVIDDIEEFNETSNGPIYLILDTPGGNVLDGGRLISTIQTSKNPVYAVNIGIAASMGFMILEHSHKRMAVPRAILMAHPASIGMMFQGELDKAVSRLSFLKSYVDKMDHYIANRVGVSYDSFKLKSDREFWLDSADALEQHYLDEVVYVKLPSDSNAFMNQNKLKETIKME
jgi:ATP-dependent Clp endopeptidase proteolytic subunit ClpP